jgi:hypothetical protein
MARDKPRIGSYDIESNQTQFPSTRLPGGTEHVRRAMTSTCECAVALEHSEHLAETFSLTWKVS